MKRKRHSPEQIIRKLRDADRMLSEGKEIAAVCQALAVCEATFHRWRNQYGITPAPERRKWIPWSTFLQSHWGSIAAADFFTVETWSCFGLTRYHVFFCMELSSRRVHIAGISECPYAERFVRTIKESCLDQMIFFGENSLRRTINEFLEYYHHERNHQGIENRLIQPLTEVGALDGRVACRERFGGVLRYYYRNAAWPCRRIES